MKTCAKCKEIIKELDEIVLLDDYNDTAYHADCIQYTPVVGRCTMVKSI